MATMDAIASPPATGQHARRQRNLVLMLAPISLLLAVFFIVPLGIMALYSVLTPGLYGGVEWSFYPYSYGRVLGAPLGAGEVFDPVYLDILLRSLRMAVMTVLLTLLIAYPAAFWVSGLTPARRNLALFLITLPFFANLLIRIYAWMLILRPSGVVNSVLKELGFIDKPMMMIFSEGAVVIGLVYVLLPFMFLPVYASVERLNRSLVHASADLGATPLQTFRRIVLPLTLPGIIGGSIIVFIPALGNFVVASLLGGAKVLMFGNLITQQFLQARNWPFGAALAMMVMATVLVLLFIYVFKIARADERAAGAR
ncbi:MAG: ABC transporter permease [Rhodospirillaceae bacterium]|nr:ABC transporter permease [Rhodospirillaceae bacterium]